MKNTKTICTYALEPQSKQIQLNFDQLVSDNQQFKRHFSYSSTQKDELDATHEIQEFIISYNRTQQAELSNAIQEMVWKLIKSKVKKILPLSEPIHQYSLDSGDESAEPIISHITLDQNVAFNYNLSDLDWSIAEKEIRHSLSWQTLKVGDISDMEETVRTLINRSSRVKVLTWLNKLFLQYNRDSLFVCSLLHTLSHMEYEEVFPHGPTMAMASLNHVDDKVVGYAIKAFSNWNTKTTLSLMRTNIPRFHWAKEQWEAVIDYIEKYGDENGIFDEDDQSDESMDTESI